MRAAEYQRRPKVVQVNLQGREDIRHLYRDGQSAFECHMDSRCDQSS